VKERRKFKRRLLVYNMEVFDSDTSEPLGRMVDITPEGLLVVSVNPITTGVTLNLYVELPSDIFGATRVNFTAVVRWCSHDINPDLFDTGLEFTQIADENMENIIGVIADYAFPD